MRINLIWVRKGPWDGITTLNGVLVDAIDPGLRATTGLPAVSPLDPPDLWGFEGVHNGKGAAFVLGVEEVRATGLSVSGLLRPYISGEDIGAASPSCEALGCGLRGPVS